MRQDWAKQDWLKPRKRRRDLSGLWLFLGLVAFEVILYVMEHYWGG